MSILEKLKESELGLKGSDLKKRDGNSASTITSTNSDLGLKGKTPSTYTDLAKEAGINIDRVVDLTPPN